MSSRHISSVGTGEILFEMFKACVRKQKRLWHRSGGWVAFLFSLSLSFLWECFPPTPWPQFVHASLRQDFLLGSCYARNVLFRDSIGSISLQTYCSIKDPTHNWLFSTTAQIQWVSQAKSKAMPSYLILNVGGHMLMYFVMSVTLAKESLLLNWKMWCYMLHVMQLNRAYRD